MLPNNASPSNPMYNSNSITHFVEDLHNNKFDKDYIMIECANEKDLQPGNTNKLKDNVTLITQKLRSPKLNGSRLEITFRNKTDQQSKELLSVLFMAVAQGVYSPSLRINLAACDEEIMQIIVNCINAPSRPSLHLSFSPTSDKILENLVNQISGRKYTQQLFIYANSHIPSAAVFAIQKQCALINSQVAQLDTVNNILQFAESGQFATALSHAVKAQNAQEFFPIWELAYRSKKAECFLAVTPANPYFEHAKKMFSELTCHEFLYAADMQLPDWQRLFKAALYCELQDVIDRLFHMMCGEDPRQEPILKNIRGDYDTLIALAEIIRQKNLLLRGKLQPISTKPANKRRWCGEIEDESLDDTVSSFLNNTNASPVNRSRKQPRFDLFTPNQHEPVTTPPGFRFTRSNMEE